MFKLLIVDDEIIIRKGLINIIDWDDYGVEIVGEASNGKDAIRMVYEEKPDIILLDIRMPYMDGLEFIRYLKSRDVDVKIIVLSGFSDFLYVKEALKLNVENYLLKPVDCVELRMTLENILEKMIKEKKAIRWNEDMILLGENILNRLINNTIDYKEFRHRAEILNLDIMNDYIQVGVIDIEVKHESQIDDVFKIRQDTFQKLKEYMNLEWGIVFEDIEGRAVILFKKTEERNEEDVMEFLNSILLKAKEIPSIRISIALGKEVDSFRYIHISYNQALDVMRYKVVRRINSIYVYSKMIKRRELYPDELKIDYKKIENYITTYDSKGFSEYIDKIINSIGDIGSPNLGRVYNFCIEIIIVIMKSLEMINGYANNIFEFSDDLYSSIIELQENSQLKKWMKKISDNTVKHLETLKGEQRYSKQVQDVITYINDHYMDQISLKTLKGVFNFNAAYMGRKFREEIGETFTDYLNKMRLNKSIELLMNTNERTVDIARKVGFQNINYFYTLFKKFMGITPTDFRRKLNLNSVNE